MKWTLLQLISVGRKNELVSSNNDSGKFESVLSEISILLLLLPLSLWTLKLIGCSSDTFSVGKNVGDFVVHGSGVLERGGMQVRFSVATPGDTGDVIGCSRSLRIEDIFLFSKLSEFWHNFRLIECFCGHSLVLYAVLRCWRLQGIVRWLREDNGWYIVCSTYIFLTFVPTSRLNTENLMVPYSTKRPHCKNGAHF